MCVCVVANSRTEVSHIHSDDYGTSVLAHGVSRGRLLVHKVRGWECARHHVHVDRRAGEGGGGGIGGGLRGRNGARVQVEVPHVNIEVWGGRTVHHAGTHGAHHGRVLLFLDLDGFGHILVPATLVALQLGLQLSKRHPQHGLQVAHEAVDVPLPGNLVDDVLVVVVPEPAGELLVVHLWLVLARAPSPCNLLWIDEFEFPIAPGPGDTVLALAVCQ